MNAFTLVPTLALATLAAPLAAQSDFEGGVYLPFDNRTLASVAGAEVVLNGNAAFASPDPEVQFVFQDDAPVGFFAEFDLRGALTAELTSSVSGDFSEVIPGPVVALPPTQFGSTLILPFAYAQIRVEGTAEAGMRVALVQQFATSLSIEVDGGIQTSLGDPPTYQNRVAAPEVTGATGLDVTVAVDAGILFLITYQGIALGGPSIEAGFGLDLGVDPLANPWWDVDGLVEVRAGLYAGFSPVLNEVLWSDAFDLADAGEPFPLLPAPPTRWSRAYDFGFSESATSVTPLESGFAVVGPGSGPGGNGWFARLFADGTIEWEQAAQSIVHGTSRPEEVHPTADGGLISGGNDGISVKARVDRLTGDGALVWSRNYTDDLGGTIGLESLAVRADGGAVFCGRVHRQGLTIPAIVFLDEDGDVEQAFELDLGGAVPYAAFQEVVPAADGGWILAGWADYDDAATSWPPTIDSRNALLCKLDALGNVVFARVVGGPGYDQAYAVAEGEDGAICAAGELKSGNDHSSWLLLVGPSGDTLWSSTYAGASETGNDGLRDVAALPGGGFVATGFSALAADRDTSLFLVDGGGMPVWWKTLRGPGHDEPTEVRWLHDGVAICGLTKSLDAAGTPPQSDLWLARTNVDGMLHFAAATGFDASNPGVKWKGESVPSVAMLGTLTPLAVTGNDQPLLLAPTAAGVTELSE